MGSCSGGRGGLCVAGPPGQDGEEVNLHRQRLVELLDHRLHVCPARFCIIPLAGSKDKTENWVAVLICICFLSILSHSLSFPLFFYPKANFS